MIQNDPQWLPELKKRPETLKKRDFSDEKIRTPKIDFRPSVVPKKVPMRIFGQFRRHDFSLFFHDF